MWESFRKELAIKMAIDVKEKYILRQLQIQTNKRRTIITTIIMLFSFTELAYFKDTT